MKRIYLAACLALACSDHPAPPAFGTTGDVTESTSTGSTTSAADTTTSGPPPVPTVVLAGTFDLEVRDAIDVEVSQFGEVGGSGEVVVRIDASAGFGVLPTSPIEGTGRIDAYPEAAATVYTATFDGPPVADGPCGAAPVTLAMSLHMVTGSPEVLASSVVAGGITAYCGQGVLAGVPAIEPLRVFGRGAI